MLPGSFSSPILEERAWGRGTGPWVSCRRQFMQTFLHLCVNNNHKIVPAYKNDVDLILIIRSPKNFKQQITKYSPVYWLLTVQVAAFIYSGLFLTVVGFGDVISWKIDCQLEIFMSNEFSYTLQEQDPQDPKTLSLVPRPRPKIGKRACSHLQKFLYVLCQQSSFGVEESRSSIANYYILDMWIKVVDSLQNRLKTGTRLARPQD